MTTSKANSAYQAYTDKGLVQSGLLWLTPEEKTKFRKGAAAAGRSMTQHLRKIVQDFLEKSNDVG